jgi:hypothetical protein
MITSRDSWVQYAAWYGPVTFSSTLCVVLMGHSVYKINKVRSAFNHLFTFSSELRSDDDVPFPLAYRRS